MTELADATVLVTGATGRVGRQLTAALLGAGATVRTVVLPEDPGRSALPPSVEALEGNLADPVTVLAAVDGVDSVVHLAAAMDWAPDANNLLFDANVKATYHLLEALAHVGTQPRRVVLASSDEVYPALQAGELITEDRPLQPYSFYGLTKELDERLAAFYYRSAGLPVAVARFSLIAEASEITRPDGWSGRLFFASGLRALFTGLEREDAVAAIDDAVSDPTATLLLPRDEHGQPYRFQFCDVRDLVHGLERLLVAPKAPGGVFNLSGPSAFTYDDVVPQLADKIGMSYRDVTIPGPRFNVEIDITRATSLIGYTPRYDVSAIVAGLSPV